MKSRFYIALIVAIMVLTNCTPVYCEPSFPMNVYGNVKANWVTYEKRSSAYKSQVVTNAPNILGVTVTGEKGIIFVTRDIVTSKREWENSYSCVENSSKREVEFWHDLYGSYRKTLAMTVLFVIVYRDKFTHNYKSYCYKAQLFSDEMKVMETKKDILSLYTLPDLEETPKLQRAINKYLEVNGYGSLDELFRAKGIE